MTINRKDFLKKACITGTCFCGFGKMAFVNAGESDPGTMQSETDLPKRVSQGWTANLVPKGLLKKCFPPFSGIL